MNRLQTALAVAVIAVLAGLTVSTADARKSHYALGVPSVWGYYPGQTGPAVYAAPRPMAQPAVAYPAPAYYQPAPVYSSGCGSCGGASFCFSFWH